MVGLEVRSRQDFGRISVGEEAQRFEEMLKESTRKLLPQRVPQCCSRGSEPACFSESC